MAQVFKPDTPNQPKLGYYLGEGNYIPSVFLAGSIEMGSAPDWQLDVEQELGKFKINIFNPRRDNWNKYLIQKETDYGFNQQVSWELNALEKVDFIFMNFDKDCKSPISLLELGMFANRNKMIVCCPEGFWRKGNVDIVCSRNNIPLYTNMYDAIGCLVTKLLQHNVEEEIVYTFPEIKNDEIPF